ncbi:MAG: glycosyltransferase [Anaerolineae bacterium]|nr:glycosyltransferase [Anaerolineae bacterium]
MRILYVTPYVPSLIRVRPYNLIRYLARRGHQVTVLALRSSAGELSDAEALRREGVEVETVLLPRWQSLLNCLRALPTRTPLQAAYCWSTALETRLRALMAEKRFDLVHVEHLRGAHFGAVAGGVPRVYDSVDCISLLFDRTRHESPRWTSRLMAQMELGRTRHYESRLLAMYDTVLVTSRDDKMALERLSNRAKRERQAPVVVLTNGVDLDYFAPMDVPREPESLVFSGKMSYHANVAAALYLAQEIMPLVWARRPQATLTLVGKNPPMAVRALASDPRIRVTGYVPDIRPYLARATVAVSPIRYGVGVQNKVLEAMAMATPVVTTPQACGALQVCDGEHLLVAEGADMLAWQIERVLADPPLAESLGRSGRHYVEVHHDWRVAAENLEQIYQRTIEAFWAAREAQPAFQRLAEPVKI